jgi:ferritin-like metal-binding protein YciE
MAIKTLSELFEHELKDIYYAEHRLVEALTELAGETKHREIKRAYTTHKKETQGQIKRLKQVFRLIGDVPEAEKCPGIEGLLKEKQNFTKKEKPSQEILDYYNLGAASKAERYEITAYEGLIEIARQLGMDQAVELLGANLQEEQATLDTLKILSQDYDTGALLAKEEEEGSSEKSPAKGSAAKSGKSGSAAKGGSKSAPASKGATKSGAASKGASGSKSASRGKGTGRGNAAGDDAGYRGEVEADSIMVAPDPVVSLGDR